MGGALGVAWEAAMDLARELSPGVLTGALDEEAALAALERLGEVAGALLAVVPPGSGRGVEQALGVIARAGDGATLAPLPDAAVRLALGASRGGRVEAEGLIGHLREVVDLALDGCADNLDADARARLEAIKAAAEGAPRRGGRAPRRAPAAAV